MTGRDRMVAIAVVILAVLGAGWVLVVSPKRQEASKLSKQVAEAQTQLSAAEGQVANARAAQAKYKDAYTAIVNLGKAVPASQEVPSLIYQLSQATNAKKVEFASIASVSAGPAANSTGTAAAASAASGFSAMPFTFIFSGSFFDLEHLFKQLNGFTLREASGGLQVSGRLLTIQSVKLTPEGAGGAAAGGSTRGPTLSGTVSASAYVLPAGQGVTGGATPTSPTGAATPVSSTTGAPSSPTPPAVAQVTP
jgi:hypothetical protein